MLSASVLVYLSVDVNDECHFDFTRGVRFARIEDLLIKFSNDCKLSITQRISPLVERHLRSHSTILFVGFRWRKYWNKVMARFVISKSYKCISPHR